MSTAPEFPAQIAQMKKMLRNLDGWIDEAVALAEAKKFDKDVLAGLRLVPDQFSFTRQIQSACDSAKLALARLSDTEAPKHDDDETTIDQLKARIASTLEWMDTVEDGTLADAAEKELKLGFLQGKAVRGADYFREFALPNFYFHVVSAYSILRANGVSLGKMKFIGSMNVYDPAS